MKRLLTAIAASVFFISPCVCTGDYVIHLKDGGRILVDKYSEDADTIRVKKFGGMMGISKALVSRIEEVETETPPEVKKVPEEKEGASEDVVVKEEGTGDKTAQENATGKEEKEKEEKKTDIARYKKEKTVLMEKYRKAQQGLREARKAKDKPGITAAKQEIKDAEKEMAALVGNLKEESGGVVPPWWFEPEREDQAGVPEGR